jgi:ectoine hydroxylase-related dioxygenase (phytanoyl-CoA dioxygenase family)
LEAGDLFLFDVALAHAGSAYVTENRRIHFIMNPPGASEIGERVVRVKIG